MSAVKIFALGVLVTGTLATSTLAGSIRSREHSSHPADRTNTADTPSRTRPAAEEVAWSAPPVLAAANLAGSPNDPGSANSGSGITGGQPFPSGIPAGGLVLNTTGSTGPLPSQDSSAVVSSAPALAAPARADAFINFGNGPYLEASSLTSGDPQSFTSSPAFTHLFPNGPTSQDISHFEGQVVATIQKTFGDANLPIHLTTNPADNAPHTMSVVSGVSNPQSPGAIGITDVGNNGFSFIDKFAAIQDPTALATAIGHNLAHELMHAFGLANHPETDGPYVDAARTTVASLTDPNSDFSPAAASLLTTLNFQDVGDSIRAGAQQIDGNQILVTPGANVPEPSTVAVWGAMVGLAGFVRHRRRKSS